MDLLKAFSGLYLLQTFSMIALWVFQCIFPPSGAAEYQAQFMLFAVSVKINMAAFPLFLGTAFVVSNNETEKEAAGQWQMEN